MRHCEPAAGGDAIGNDRLICRDVVRGHMLDGDLLLAAASVVVEPFRQHHHGAGRLIRQLQIFRPRLEKLRRLRPALLIHRQRRLVRRHQLRDQYSLDGISRRHIHHAVRDGQTCLGDGIFVFRVSDRQRVDDEMAKPLVPFVGLPAAKQLQLALWPYWGRAQSLWLSFPSSGSRALV